MGQLTIRADDHLVERIKAAAAEADRSMNAWVTMTLDIATDPTYAGDEGDQIRERFRRAGLLAEFEAPTARPSDDAIQRAGDRAAQGHSVGDLVHENR